MAKVVLKIHGKAKKKKPDLLTLTELVSELQ